MKYYQTKFEDFQNQTITEYIIETDHMQFSFLDYGARIHKILTDKNDDQSNIILSMNTIEDYNESGGYFGATIGRVAGRIARGRFDLNGKSYQLEQNDGENHLHGGSNAVDKRIWMTTVEEQQDAITLKFKTVIYERDDHYPGDITFEVHHTVTSDNVWKIEYFAVSTEDTLFNPTNHVYFNLNKDYHKKIMNHQLQLNHDQFVEIDETLIPTGHIKNSPNFDFSDFQALETGIMNQDEDNQLVDGYDHPFLLQKGDEKTFTLTTDSDDITIDVTTDRSCVVIYTSNMLNYRSSDDIVLEQYSGVTVETQEIPDAINHADFGNIILRKDDTYYSSTQFTIIN
ncbi:aldose epimerase family protein [Macrococcus lamae]|nr:aldose epimerase family protein [Macrococcus lamae]